MTGEALLTGASAKSCWRICPSSLLPAPWLSASLPAPSGAAGTEPRITGWQEAAEGPVPPTPYSQTKSHCSDSLPFPSFISPIWLPPALPVWLHQPVTVLPALLLLILPLKNIYFPRSSQNKL